MTETKSKKRKRDEKANHKTIDTSKPSAVFNPTGQPRKHTLSVALPGSFLNNAHSFDLKTTLAGQIARALAVFCVDEVVIFDDGVKDNSSNRNGQWQGSHKQSTPPNDLLALLLTYLETPPHMRTRLFPINPDLQKAGLLPSLDIPHHLRRDEWCQYREGVTVSHDDSSAHSQPETGHTLVDVGTGNPVEVPVEIPANTRITIKYPDSGHAKRKIVVDAVAPSTPREEAGWYWGYEVRQASSLSDVFTECSWEGGYDASIGTSERGQPVQVILDLFQKGLSGEEPDDSVDGQEELRHKLRALKSYSHLLLVFGGHQGLEVAVRNDAQLQNMGVDQPETMFDWWTNLCPGQGSRTIRTEEAVWLGLMAFRDIIDKRGNSV